MPPKRDPDGVEDALQAAFKEHGVTDGSQIVIDEVAVDPEPPAEDPAPAEEAREEDPAPAEDGDETPAPAEEAAEAEEPGDEDDPPAEGALEPPEHWRETEKERFREVTDPKAQQLLLDREAHTAAAWREQMTRVNDDLSVVQSVRNELEPFMDKIKDDGLTEVQALQNMIRAAGFFANDPRGYIKWAAESQGIDLAELSGAAPAGGGESGDDDEFTDPVVKELQKSVEALGGQVRSFMQGEETRRVNAEQAQSAADFRNMMEEMASEKDAAGNEKFPYFVDVLEAMGQELAAVKAQGRPLPQTKQDLATLYDRVKWTVPDVRERLIESRNPTPTPNPNPQSAQQREHAKRAAAAETDVPSQDHQEREPPRRNGQYAGRLNDVEEDVRRAWDEAAGRVT